MPNFGFALMHFTPKRRVMTSQNVYENIGCNTSVNTNNPNHINQHWKTLTNTITNKQIKGTYIKTLLKSSKRENMKMNNVYKNFTYGISLRNASKDDAISQSSLNRDI